MSHSLPIPLPPIARTTVLTAPVVSESPVWRLGNIPTAPLWEATKSGFVEVGRGDITRRLPTGARDLGLTFLGRKTGLPGKPLVTISQYAREQNGKLEFISRENASHKQVRKFFSQRGLVRPKKLNDDDWAVLGTLKLPQAQKTPPRHSVNVQRDWVRTPAWQELREQLSFATQHAQAGRTVFAYANLKAADKIAKELTGLSLRPEIVTEILEEAETRKAAIKTEEEIAYRKEISDALESFKTIAAESATGKSGSGNALTDYLDLETVPSLLPRGGDTFEERGAYGPMPKGIQIGLTNHEHNAIRGIDAGLLNKGGLTLEQAADAAATSMLHSARLAARPGRSRFDSTMYDGFVKPADHHSAGSPLSWESLQRAGDQRPLSETEIADVLIRILGLGRTPVFMVTRLETDPIDSDTVLRVERVTLAMGTGGNGSGDQRQNRPSAFTDPLGETVVVSTATIESATILAGGTSAWSRVTSAIMNMARRLYAMLSPDPRK